MKDLEIIQILAELGTSGLLLYFLIRVWKEKQDDKKFFRDEDTKRAEEMRNVNKQILEVVKDNTKTQEKLRSSINENIKATETLTAQIYRVLNK